jgi:DNA-binding IclR family transcriptional regulator
MLRAYGFVTQMDTSKVYRAGRGLLEIGLGALTNLEVRAVARPELEWLVAMLDETVQLIILPGKKTLVIDAVECTVAVRVSARTGGSAPPNCVSAGKVLLARMPFSRVRDLLGPDPLTTLTPHSISTLDELEAELAKVRVQGYALNREESEAGLTSISVEITVPPLVTPAAITVSAPSARMPDERLQEVVETARKAAQRITDRISGSI